MNNSGDFDMYEFDDDLLYDVNPSGYSFDKFKLDYPSYLDSLNNCIKLLYNTYILVHNKRFLKIKKNPECLEVASRCGLGMLMRHAMETIVTSIATENGVEVGGRSVFERLEAMKGQNLSGYDNTKKVVLSKLLDLTNEIAHPHVLNQNATSFSQLEAFYNESFKNVLSSHIEYIENLMKNSRAHDFGITKEALKGRKQAYKYLCMLRNQLDNFNVFTPATNILIQGCLVRQLTECTANLWGYNCGIVPTDVSTYENQISLGKVLDSLSRISKENRRNAFGSSALTVQVVNNLFDLKNASNSLMHVEKFASRSLAKQGKSLSELHKVIKTECSPHVMKKKLSDAGGIGAAPRKRIREKYPSLAALLCGIFGWLGAHHFYVGSIGKGIVYVLFLGFIIGPTVDLYKMLNGKFRNGRGIRMKRTGLSTLIALILLLTHLFIWYNVGMKLYESGIVDKIKEYLPLDSLSLTLEKCDNSEIDTMSKIDVSASSSSSHLVSKSIHYDEKLCIDSNPYTCWQDGVEGIGEGESLTFVFPTQKPISAISILGGKHTNEKAYSDNARPAKVNVKIGNVPYSIDLEDVMQRQTFRFATPREAGEVTIVIESAYPGNVWEDLCISEIEFYE